MTDLPVGPYKAYDLMTHEFLGGYAAPYLAYEAHPDRSVDVVYRPGRKKKVK